MGRRGRRPLQNRANIGGLTVERTMFENKKRPPVAISLKRGCGGNLK